MAKTHWIMDVETLSNCFTAVFEAHNSNKRKVFVIHELRDDSIALVKFLKSNAKNKSKHIGFNNLEFDSQVIQYIYNSAPTILSKVLPPDEIARSIYNYAQETIRRSRNNEFAEYPPWTLNIQQIDLYKMNHWDNAAKRSSLKWIQFSIDWFNLQDMPIHHSTEIKTKEQIEEIIEYNINDVASTKKIFEMSKDALNLRMELSKEFKKDLLSSSETSISKTLFLEYLSNETGTSVKQLKKARTIRTTIDISEVILDNIKFSTKVFQELLESFKELKVDAMNLKGCFKKVIEYKGVKTHFGLGGVHGANKPGIYKSNEEFIIVSSDVTSFYPNLIIRNLWAPNHIPKIIFNKMYESFYDKRKKIPKTNIWNKIFKLLLNSTYGLSNDRNSFLYDPKLTMQVTINGQLSLMMLYEKIMESIPGAISIMQNTDGIEIAIPRSYMNRYMMICNSWERLTKLELEHDYYDTLVLADVNNYIGIFQKKEVSKEEYDKMKVKNPYYKFVEERGKYYYHPVKLKGRFEFHNLDLHKNKSKLVVRKGIHAYFINNILPKDYVKSNRNIMDYCIASRVKGDWKVYAYHSKDGKLNSVPIQKVNRYYISNKGVKIIKQKGKSVIKTESGPWMQTIFNTIEKKPFEEYGVNENYYILGIESEISKIYSAASNQKELF